MLNVRIAANQSLHEQSIFEMGVQRPGFFPETSFESNFGGASAIEFISHERRLGRNVDFEDSMVFEEDCCIAE